MRVLCAGDSYTVGEGIHPDGSWPRQLAARLTSPTGTPSLEVVGRTGMTVAEVHRAVTAAGPAPPYDLVTVQVGVNDHYRGGSPAGCAADLDLLMTTAIELAGARPGRVLVLSIPDWSVTPHAAGRDRPAVAAAVDRFNDLLAEVAVRRGGRWVDVTTASRAAAGRPAMLAPDGLHPSALQYAAWLEHIEPAAAAALGDAAD